MMSYEAKYKESKWVKKMNQSATILKSLLLLNFSLLLTEETVDVLYPFCIFNFKGMAFMNTRF